MDLNAKINEFLNSDEYMSKWSFDARRIAIAKEDGIDIGRMNNQREVVLNMHDKNFTVYQISLVTNLSQDEVLAIIDEYQVS